MSTFNELATFRQQMQAALTRFFGNETFDIRCNNCGKIRQKRKDAAPGTWDTCPHCGRKA